MAILVCVNPAHLATEISASLPAWVLEELRRGTARPAHAEDRVRLANRLASRNHYEGSGGPFAALVVDADSGELISVGVNVVLASNLSSQHAEVTAIGLAQARLGHLGSRRRRTATRRTRRELAPVRDVLRRNHVVRRSTPCHRW